MSSKLKAIAAHCENKNASKILKMCRFRTYPTLNPKRMHRSIYRYWVDDYCNTIKIANKRLNIKYNDLDIDKSKIHNTDLYAGLNIKDCAKISKLSFIFQGSEIDLNTDHYIVSFLGLDNYLRTYVYIYGEWQTYPSIYLGVNILNFIISNLDIQTFKEIKYTKPIIYKCNNQKSYVAKYPLHKFFIQQLKKENSFLFDTLNIGE